MTGNHRDFPVDRRQTIQIQYTNLHFRFLLETQNPNNKSIRKLWFDASPFPFDAIKCIFEIFEFLTHEKMWFMSKSMENSSGLQFFLVLFSVTRALADLILLLSFFCEKYFLIKNQGTPLKMSAVCLYACWNIEPVRRREKGGKHKMQGDHIVTPSISGKK